MTVFKCGLSFEWDFLFFSCSVFEVVLERVNINFEFLLRKVEKNFLGSSAD